MPSPQKEERKVGHADLAANGRRNRRKWRLVPTLSFIDWRREPGFQPVPNIPWLYLERSWGGRLVVITVKYCALRFDFRHDWVAEITEIQGP